MSAPSYKTRQRGTTMVEVLVTLIIVAIGLLGVVGLQARLQSSELESYQRSQAIVLLDDVASRISSNRHFAANYETTAANPLGAGMACPVNGGLPTRQQIDTAEWCTALQGAAEVAAGTNSGAMIGARGCVETLPGNEYLITVAWQGVTPLTAPPASVACGANLYDGPPSSTCTADRCRRVVTTIVRSAQLN